MASGCGQAVKDGFGRWPSPCSGYSVRLTTSLWIGLTQVTVTGPFEGIWSRLPPSSLGLSLVPEDEAARQRPHAGRERR